MHPVRNHLAIVEDICLKIDQALKNNAIEGNCSKLIQSISEGFQSIIQMAFIDISLQRKLISYLVKLNDQISAQPLSTLTKKICLYTNATLSVTGRYQPATSLFDYLTEDVKRHIAINFSAKSVRDYVHSLNILRACYSNEPGIIASWIDINRIPIKKLGLKGQELESIGLHLSHGDLRAFNECSIAKYKNANTLFIGNAIMISDLHLMINFSKLTDLGIGEMAFKKMSYISELTQLTALSLPRNIQSKSMVYMTKLTRLTSLDLSFCLFGNTGLQYLTGLTKLKKLNFEHVKAITHEGIGNLTGLTKLEELNFENCKRIDDSILPILSCFSNLKSLNLNGCKIREFGLKFPLVLNNIEVLNVSNLRLHDQSFELIKKFTNLKKLSLSGCWGLETKIPIQFCELKNLATLEIERMDLNSDYLKIIGGIKSLTSLNLKNSTGINDEGLKYLAENSNWTELNLHGCEKISDLGIGYFSTLTNLKILDLTNCKLSSKGVKNIDF